MRSAPTSLRRTLLPCQRAPSWLPPLSLAIGTLHLPAWLGRLQAHHRGYAEVADFIVRTALTEGRLQPAVGSIDFILPVPIEDTRLEKRGYNQAALLAQALSTHYYHVPCREDFLLRHRKSHSQTTLHREERMENARKAFYLTPRRELLDELKGKRILLVDDILTTGSTLLSLCDLLESCGVREVHVFVSAVALPRL